ncbi:methyltransferase domain-containing protein [Rhodohalobacter sulfatireducens]|uniref:Arsenite methyltransferase n=1 Tax=Rhodohalobacter sulfatireducens TaxID=2911366 RepID=A0ABS9KEH7_9BACT|nr:methyltransferase domain-containing protein [Rhodohalobacter sulfatireducens]MCG2589262.1 methyltransferase domain-containing protein [Rhodohalobacter sulfatireducens]
MQTITKFNEVKEYYGKVLKKSKDLKSSACCTTESLPDWQKEILKDIEDEVVTRFYGCGSPIPLDLEGITVLDLGCGTGRDLFMVSKLVGENGHVIGIDMTEEQLEVGRRLTDKQTKRFGFEKPNVSFLNGYIEDLDSVGLEDNSVDVVISNCVINLSPDKKRVFSEIFRVLKPGGELYFSDVFTDRRVPRELQEDPVLYGECLSGAMYMEDFRRLLRETGCLDYRVLSESPISLDNPEIEKKVGMINFYSMTIRAFKLNSLEDICEDYGQVAVYKGSIPHAPHRFELDDHHIFETGKPMLVCGNTAAMLEETRFKNHFTVAGDRSVHYGAFDCGDSVGLSEEKTTSGGCC